MSDAYLVFVVAGPVLGGKMDGRELAPGPDVARNFLKESYRIKD